MSGILKFEPRNTNLSRDDVNQINKLLDEIGKRVGTSAAPTTKVASSPTPIPGTASFVNTDAALPSPSSAVSTQSGTSIPPPAGAQGQEVLTDGATITGDGSANPIGLISPTGNRAVLQITTAESIPDTTVTALTFPAGGTPSNPVFDTAGFYDPTNNTRLTAPADGIYSLNVLVRWAANSTGQRRLLFFKNGNVVANTELAGTTFISTAAGNDPVMSISWQGFLLGGEYVEAYVQQVGIGAPLNTQYQTFTISQAPF